MGRCVLQLQGTPVLNYMLGPVPGASARSLQLFHTSIFSYLANYSTFHSRGRLLSSSRRRGRHCKIFQMDKLQFSGKKSPAEYVGTWQGKGVVILSVNRVTTQCPPFWLSQVLSFNFTHKNSSIIHCCGINCFWQLRNDYFYVFVTAGKIVVLDKRSNFYCLYLTREATYTAPCSLLMQRCGLKLEVCLFTIQLSQRW
jgi:hypothetical protein